MSGATHGGTMINFAEQTFPQQQPANTKPTQSTPSERISTTTFIHASEPGANPRSKRSFAAYSEKDTIALLKILIHENPFAARFGDKLSAWKRFCDALATVGHFTNPKKCREFATKLLEDNESSEWFKARIVGEKPELTEKETLLERAIFLKRAGSSNTQKPDGSSPRASAGNESQIPSPPLVSTFATQPQNYSMGHALGQELFRTHLTQNPPELSNLGITNAPEKVVRPHSNGTLDVNQPGLNKRLCLAEPCEKDKEIDRLNKSINELKNQISQLNQSVSQTNETMRNLLLENQTTFTEFLSVIHALIDKAP